MYNFYIQIIYIKLQCKCYSKKAYNNVYIIKYKRKLPRMARRLKKPHGL